MLVRCAVCGNEASSPCRDCVVRLKPAEPPCPDGLDSCAAAFLYVEGGRTLVSSMKYRNQRQSLSWIASAMVHVLAPEVIAAVDLVSWIPTTPRRRRSRGYDQAELLARRVARRLDIGARPLLTTASHRGHSSQTGLTAVERHQRVRFRASSAAAGNTILLVDDVLTTGASLEASASALSLAGALSVHGVAAAFTPAPADR